MTPARTLATSVATIGLLVAGAVPALAATHVATAGTAFGSTAHLAGVAHSGKSARVALCTTKPGVRHADHTHSSSQAQLGHLGEVHTSVSSQHTNGVIASVSKARTDASALLSQNVTGKAFIARARAAHSSKGFGLTGGTTLTDVVIFGHKAPQHPTANQKMALPGIGSVILNHQQRSHKYGQPRITVTALQLNLSGGNSIGLPGGTVVISRATASLHKPTHHQASGNAYGTRAANGKNIESDKTAPITLPCGGSGGEIINKTTGATTKALRSSSTRTQARSADGAHRTSSILRSKVNGVDLLAGVVRANAVIARAKAMRRDGALSRISNGTKIVGLTINGKKQSGDQPANTKYSIPNVGTLWVHRVVKTNNGLHVYALQLKLAKAQGGLSKGTLITIAGATAAVAKR